MPHVWSLPFVGVHRVDRTGRVWWFSGGPCRGLHIARWLGQVLCFWSSLLENPTYGLEKISEMLRGFAMRRPRKADSMSLYSQRNSTRKIWRALVESPHTSGYASRESIRNFLRDLPVRITRKLAWVTSCRLLLQVLNVRFVSTGIGRNQRGPQMRICAGVPILNWSLFSCILDMLVLWCVKLLQNVANFCPEEKSFGVLPDGGLPSSIRGRDGTWWHDGTVGRILNPATFTWRIQALWTFPAWLIAPFFKLSLRCA